MYIIGTPFRSRESETVRTGASKQFRLPYKVTRVILTQVDIQVTLGPKASGGLLPHPALCNLKET